LSTWREFQLEILNAAKQLHRTAMEREQAVSENASPARATLWAMMGEAFWIESDQARLARMIEEIIAELENHGAVSSGGTAGR